MDKNVEEVVERMIARADIGYRKYGVTTERTDLSTYDWLTHLQEELMDGCIYIQRLKNDIKRLSNLD
jgi:hypothetical protein